MSNTKAWIGAAGVGALAYFGLGSDAAQEIMNYFRITPNSASDLETLQYLGQWLMAGAGICAAGSIAEKVTKRIGLSKKGGWMRKAGIEGMVDTAIIAKAVDTDYFKQMLYNLHAYHPGTQSQMDFGAKVAFVAFLAAFAYSYVKKEEPKK